MGYLSLLLLGGLLSVLGVINLRGNTSTIHWYNRAKVRPEDVPKYGRLMGAGTLTIGGSIVVTALLQLRFDTEGLMVLIALGCLAGLSIMLYAQLKYNRGIF